MSDPTGVALFSDFEWPEGALGTRPLLVFESYEPRVLSLPGQPGTAEGTMSSLVERGFELLTLDAWSFPTVPDHQIVISDDLDDFAVIDDYAEELFAHPLNGLPAGWLGHLQRDRVCLVITGVDLRLATQRLAGGP